MDLRDDTHTQLKDHIATLRVLATQKPPSELMHEEQTRYFAQAATVLETFILPTITEVTPVLDLRTGKVGNFHKIAEYVVVGATSAEAADVDDGLVPERPAFLNSHKP